MELDDDIYEKILKFSEKGDQYLEKLNFSKAILNYTKALELVPLPKQDWDASTWLYTAIGDAYFIDERYEEAITQYYNALNCPEGIDNPYINLKLGEGLFEISDMEKAKEYLLRAYMLDGYQIFNEEDDKYIQLILDII